MKKFAKIFLIISLIAFIVAGTVIFADWYNKSNAVVDNEQINDNPLDDVVNDPSQTHDVWDGSRDSSWYKAGQNEFILTTPEQLAGLADLDSSVDFRGKTIKLGADIYLNDKNTNNLWEPVYESRQFQGAFDGQNYTIYGLKIEPDEPLDACGMFVKIGDVDYFKNLNFENVIINNVNDNVNSQGTGIIAAQLRTGDVENITINNATINGCGVGTLFGSLGYALTNSVVFNNIVIKNTMISGENIGGLFGWATPSFPTVKNCDIEINFDASSKFAGVGFKGSYLTITFDNVNLNLTGSANDFSAYVNDNQTVVYSPAQSVLIKNSKIIGDVNAVNSSDLGKNITFSFNCENNLKVNGQSIQEELGSYGENINAEVVNLFIGLHKYIDETSTAFDAYQLVISNSGAVLNLVSRSVDSTIIEEELKTYSFKETIENENSVSLILIDGEGLEETWTMDLTGSGILKITNETGVVADRDVSAAA